MRYSIFIIPLMILTSAHGQKAIVDFEILSSKQVTELLTDTVQKSLDIHFSIFRTYKYTDKSGQYYFVLTESKDVITADNKDTFNNKIRAINLKNVNGKLSKVWELTDNIIKDDKEESSVWFWTKYIDFRDHDKDGLIDPIIIYGTSALNGSSDGRIKFLIYYKGRKIVIRHQNGVMDFERETQVDKAFYGLPEALQSAVKQKMELMVNNENAIFPYGWQTAMKNRKTIFNERKQ